MITRPTAKEIADAARKCGLLADSVAAPALTVCGEPKSRRTKYTKREIRGVAFKYQPPGEQVFKPGVGALFISYPKPIL